MCADCVLKVDELFIISIRLTYSVQRDNLNELALFMITKKPIIFALITHKTGVPWQERIICGVK